jgi:DNA-binding helix-hairpin-helix protein with protein kinase domain
MNGEVWLVKPDGRRSPATLDSPIGSTGSQGQVFRLRERPGTVVKVIHQADRRALGTRLGAMLAEPPGWIARAGRPAVAWPVATVHTRRDDRLLGYAAPELAAPRYAPLPLLFNPTARARLLPGASWAWWLAVAEDLARVVHLVHQRGYVIGDLAPTNIFVSASADVCLIDADGWQVHDGRTGEDLLCPFSRPEYTAPEELDMAARRRDPTSDRWALAVVSAQLLCLGFHPFGGVPSSHGELVEEVDNVRARRCRLLGADLRGPASAVPPDALPVVLRRRLAETFGTGYDAPADRPEPRSWAAALAYTRRELVTCSVSPTHVHPRELASCPWCAMVAAGVRDPFPTGRR